MSGNSKMVREKAKREFRVREKCWDLSFDGKLHVHSQQLSTRLFYLLVGELQFICIVYGKLFHVSLPNHCLDKSRNLFYLGSDSAGQCRHISVTS